VTIAIAALGLALLAAAFVAWPLLRPRAAAPAPAGDERREALEAEKLLALRAIRELELERQLALLGEEDYAELRARYEARAAAVLRQLDALPAPAARPAAAAPAGGKRRRGAPAPPPRPVPWTQRPLVLGGGALAILVFGVVLGVLVVRFTGPAPPEPLAAMAPPPVAGGPGGGPLVPADGAEAAAGPARPLPPGVLQGMLAAAHQSLDAGRYQEAIAAYKAVLKREPQNVDAITHLGIILAIAGHADAALEAFDKALAIQPDYAHALWDKARVLYEQRQDYAGAIATWERFMQVSGPGEDRDNAQKMIREARGKLAAQPAGAKP